MLTAKDIKGMYAIIPTPAKPGSEDMDATHTVDFEETTNLINKLLADGVSGLIALGTTGECATVSSEEYKELVDCILNTVNKRVPVFIGTTALGAHDTFKRLKFVHEKGADGSLLGLPMWQPLTQEMAVSYYKSVSELFPQLAIMAYANARAFRFDFNSEFWGMVSRAAPTITSAKFSNSKVLAAALDATGGRINFVPIDSSAFEFFSLAEETTTACWATAASMGPQPSIALMKAIEQNDKEAAKAISMDIAWANEVIDEIISDPTVFASYNIQFEKARISAAGYCNPGPVRPPYNFLPKEIRGKCEENGKRWTEICIKYRD